MKEELERSEGELNRLLLQDKMARRQSVTKVSVYVCECIIYVHSGIVHVYMQSGKGQLLLN